MIIELADGFFNTGARFRQYRFRVINHARNSLVGNTGQGGNIIALGAPAFRTPVRKVNGKWMSEEDIRADRSQLAKLRHNLTALLCWIPVALLGLGSTWLLANHYGSPVL